MGKKQHRHAPEGRTPQDGEGRARENRLRAGATVEVEVERILPGGLGLAHVAGQTVLVALAAPGDRMRARIERVRGAVAFASIAEIVEPSPVRVEPPCPYFGRCGGCDFQQLTYQAQLGSKVEIIRDCLRRIARIEPPTHIPITASPNIWHYRSRAEWQYQRRGSRLGYFERGTHNICDVVECPVIVPELQETLGDLRAEVHAHQLPVDATEFRAVTGDGAAVTLTSPLDTGANQAEALRTVAGERYRFNADCFFQINHDLLAPLVHAATADAAGAKAVDLYCGVGLFTLPLARRFEHVTGVEGNPAACEYARLNLADAHLDNATIETSGVGEWLMRHAETHAPVELVLLDPPRAGAEGDAAQGILALQPARIAYVSCDPATLARDLKIFTTHGYHLDSLQAFDMFPQTHHVETVAQLTRASS